MDMSSKASLRDVRRQKESKAELKRRMQSIRVLVVPRVKYARLTFVPVKTHLRQSTVHKVFEDKTRYDRERRKTEKRKTVLNTSGGVFGERLIEMTVLKKDVDQRVQDVLDIIFELEGRKIREEPKG